MNNSEHPGRRVFLANFFTVGLLFLKVAASVLTLPLCFRYLGTERTNIWVLLLTITNYLSLLELGLSQITMNTSGAAYARGDREEVSRVVSTSVFLLVTIASTLIVLSLSALLLFPLERLLLQGAVQSQQLLKNGLMVIVPLSLARIPASAMAGTMSGLRDHHLRVGLEGLQVIVFLITFWLVLAFGGDLMGLVWWTSLSMLACSCILFLAVKRRHRFIKLDRAHNSASLRSTLLREVWHYAPLPLCLLVQKLAPVTLTSRYIGIEKIIEIYLLSMMFRSFLSPILDSISESAQPYIIMLRAQNDDDRMRFHWTLSTRIVTTFSVLALPPALLLYGIFVRIVTHSEQIPSILALFSFGLLFLIEAILTPGINYSIALGHFSSLSPSWIVNSIMTVALGMTGAQLFTNDPVGGLSLGLLTAHLLVYLPMQVRIFANILHLSAKEFVSVSFGRVLLLLPVLFPVLYLAMQATANRGIWARVSITLVLVGILGIALALQFKSEEKNWIIQQTRSVWRAAVTFRA